MIKVEKLDIPDVLLIQLRAFGDSRGWFAETWSPKHTELGVPGAFVQDNLSRSSRGTLRGMHLQHPYGQGKLVYVPDGEVFDVAIDVRRGSPWFGKWVGATLSSNNHRQLYIPPGFAHGFCVLSETALFAYKCTDAYHPEAELGVKWDDPEVGVRWPVTDPTISAKDANHPLLQAIDVERLPSYR